MQEEVETTAEEGVEIVGTGSQSREAAQIRCNICQGERRVVEDPSTGGLACGGCLNPLYVATARRC